LVSAWRYLDDIVPGKAGAAREAMEWARRRTPWLDAAPPPSQQGVVTLADGSAAAFLARPGGSGIGQRFAALVDEPVERLVVISPYWDDALLGLAALETWLAPTRTQILLDTRSHVFPLSAVRAHHEIVDIADVRPGRFTHAKLLLARTATHDHLLIGSANCSLSALGTEAFDGRNAEACLYRRLPRGMGTAALNLDALLDRSAADPSEIEPVTGTPLPLKALAAQSPGFFELDAEHLVWAVSATRWIDGGLAVLDHAMAQIAFLPAETIAVTQDERRVHMPEAARATARFLRVVAPEGTSAPGFLTRRAMLRQSRKEPASGAVIKALAEFETDDLDLFLQQSLDALFREDFKPDREPVARATRRRPETDVVEESEARRLSYEAFMREHPAQETGGKEGNNLLSGLHCDAVRALLNRLSGYQARPDDIDKLPPGDPGDDDDEINDGISGDGDADEASAELPADPVDETEVEISRKPVDAALFQKRVKLYCDALRAGVDPLGPQHVLCLRLWIMTILYHAACAARPKGLAPGLEETGWPRMLVRIISTFFGKSRPAIARLEILSHGTEGLPVDFAECWATAIWALEAVQEALPPRHGHEAFRAMLPLLRVQLIAALALSPADLATDVMMERFRAFDRLLGRRLGIRQIAPSILSASLGATDG
jgi:hypothetical protein